MKNEKITLKKKKARGIKLGRKIGTAFRWVIRPRSAIRSVKNPISGILSMIRVLQRRALETVNNNSGRRRDCVRLGRVKPVEDSAPKKGHLAVYVGESDGDTRRVMVPVMYFNHPLFGELLEEAERVYGFDRPGGISIPIGYKKFEKVKMRIDAWGRRG
ncbi:unnamed protein product [Linum trigynum]|uniref:Small auxin up regulated protein n=1 Tax=Linum trigynum TaxID=586398 RepID=A0AAV2FSQ7_9ROSI